jgi:hypothetical protein
MKFTRFKMKFKKEIQNYPSIELHTTIPELAKVDPVKLVCTLQLLITEKLWLR